MSSIKLHIDQQNIAHLLLDKMDAQANLMDQAFSYDLEASIGELKTSPVTGVIVRSAKRTFFAGGDLNMLADVGPDDGQLVTSMLTRLKAAMRALETMAVPVVACINGAALGGGWELALACHHRIALKDKKIKLGLPEVTLGLLPGAGGITRMVRLLGLEQAMPYLTEGKEFNPQKGLESGLIHQLVDSEQELLEQAINWIFTHSDAQQPWDVKGYKLPGGQPSAPKVAAMLPILPAMIRQKTQGVLPAPEAIVAAMVEGAQVDFDTACRIESRYFLSLVRGNVAKNMINTFWFQLNEIKAGASRPKGIAHKQVTKVAVVGAGMMGAGIAYACACRGMDVVLKDVSLEQAEKGKRYSAGILAKKVARGRLNQQQADKILDAIRATNQVEMVAGCELVIEAVFEDRQLKAKVTREVEAVLPESAVFASNTSTLPITGLADASQRPSQFAGLHFFSPVDKMPLVEIICGQQTSNETLALCYDFVLQIGKTPIVVNDSRGFYTSRVFSTFVKEGMAMLGEGIHPATIENAASLAGFPVGPLAVTDEVSLTLIERIRRQTILDLAAEGKTPIAHPSDGVIDQMLELERTGKALGKGFYQYSPDGSKHLWPELGRYFGPVKLEVKLQEVKERLLFIMALETLSCLQEGVLNSVADANLGSIFGIGFPAWTGGTVQYVNQYGLSEFLQQAQQFADKFGTRFQPPQLLIQAAEKGEKL